MRIKSINKIAWLQIDKDNDAEDFIVELRDEGLSAKTKVYGYMSDSIIDLFRYMKDNWNRKPKSKKWTSLEGEFELNFEMDGLGHITLVVVLCPNLFDGWKVTSNIFLEPNQLNEIYEEISQTFKK